MTLSGPDYSSLAQRQPALFACIVTYRRPDNFRRMLDVLARQTLRPVRVFAIDNAPMDENRRAAHASSLRVEYIPAAENLGPAGGIALSMVRALEVGHPMDWLLSLDDGSPPWEDSLLEQLFRFAVEHSCTPEVAAVGVSGSRFDFEKARIIRVPDHQLEGAVSVDVIAGGHLPMYRLSALAKVGVFNPDLFFGFEELEYGLRLRRAGFELLVSGELWYRGRCRWGRIGRAPTAVRWRMEDYSWRSFYSTRNLLAILLAHGCTLSALRVALGRGLIKPVANLAIGNPAAMKSLRWNATAIIAAFAGQMGRTLDPEQLPASSRQPGPS